MRKWVNLLLCIAGWVLPLMMPGFCRAEVAGASGILNLLPVMNAKPAARDVWSRYAPVCRPNIDGQVIAGYPSKKDCNDGDMTLFNGLLCVAGSEMGCSGVKRAQSADGRFWRSPGRSMTNNWGLADTGQASFSPDMDLGVQLYVATTGDTAALQSWLDWLERNRPCAVCQPTKPNCTADNGCMIKGFPRYCFKPECSLSVSSTAATMLKASAKHYDLVVGEGLARMPKAGEMDELILVGAQLNKPGYSRHLVGVQILLMREMGLGKPETLQTAASLLAQKEPMNPFFAYLDKGKTAAVRALVSRLCPANPADILNQPEPKLDEWAWERTDSDAAWRHGMLWDCLFMDNLVRH